MNHAPSDPTRARLATSSANLAGERLSTSSLSESPASHWIGMPSEDDQRLHNVGVAALAAVSHYPHSVIEGNDAFLVSEVVNAVRDRPAHFYQPQSQFYASFDANLATQHGHQHYLAQDAVDSVPSEAEMASMSRDSESDVDMNSVVQDLIERTGPWEHFATIADLHDHDNNQKDMVMDYDSIFEEDYTSPSSGPDDDLEDLIKFYPGEEDYLRQRIAPRSPEMSMRDINVEEFYRNVDYGMPNINMGISQIHGNMTPSVGPFPDDQMQPAEEHPATVVHTTSTP